MGQTTIETSVVAELLKTVGSLHKELGEIKDQLARLDDKIEKQAEFRRSLARDVKCISDGVHEFKNKFEPYLNEAVKTKAQNEELSQKVKASVVGWGTVSVIAASVLGIGYFILEWIKSHGPSP